MLPQTPLHAGANQAPRAPSDAGPPGHGSRGLTSGPGGDHGGPGGLAPSGPGQGAARSHTGQAQGAGGRNLARSRASTNEKS